MIMVTKKRTELLDHPLVSALLKKKWTSIGLIFYLLNIFLYVLYLAMLTGFALDVKAPYKFTNVSTDVKQDRMSLFAAFAKYSVIVLTAIELIIEICEMKLMFSCTMGYFKEKENILQLITYILSILFVIHPSGSTDTGYRPEWQWTCGTVSVFLAWINLLLLIQKFDWIGIYVVMLFRVGILFLKLFLVFSFLIVAFAITFHCLLQNQEPFSTFWISLVKTTEMMIGELDYTTIFLDEKVHYNAISHVFFYIFMLFMTIVAVNLMVGLAVDKIREFQTKAGLAKKEMQIKFALELERLSASWKYRKCSGNVQDRQNGTTEVLKPSELNWLQRKILKSWKLTEQDIRQALTSGTDGISKEITTLKREMKHMDSELMAQMKNEVQTINTDMQEEMRKMESRWMPQLNMIEGTKTEMGSMESRLMSQLNVIKGTETEMKNMESRLISQLNRIEGAKIEMKNMESGLQNKMEIIDTKLMTIIQNLKQAEDKASTTNQQTDKFK
ncbi:transient receptor potential cation channel subfamily A member 1 homolog [Mercenaria mercenaria]|uniref:transient receptor potential cation channel subfamily A member 1 homolog n=1 Tax=Mercenaria mercenaria TaxID=6596 RepID=UPI00234F8494|nr:transient receptor potential cation channel subfamily A member 1 homolog [Mercenaria mercenaria]